MSNDKIYLSQAGYKQFMAELDELRNSLANNGKNKSDAFISAVGDGWHDNFAFEEAKREELRIQGLIQQKLEEMKRIEIIDDANEDMTIGVDDYVDLDMIYGESDIEEKLIKLVGSSTPNFIAEIPEISLNSPLGKSIYGKKVGDQVFYKVNETRIDVVINSKSKNLESIKSLKKEKKF